MKKLPTLITIIVLLVILLPLTIIGIVYKNTSGISTLDNSNHELKYNGYLYFYNNSDKLVGKYKCKNLNCNYADYSTNSDTTLETMSYQASKSSFISNRFAFIIDDRILLYDAYDNKIIDYYDKVINYEVGLNGEKYIVLKDNKYGLISLNKVYKQLIKPEYDFLGLYQIKDETTGKLKSNNFAAIKNNKWAIIDSTNSVLFNSDSDITSYNESYINVKNSVGEYYSFDYSNRAINMSPMLYLSFINDIYLAVTSENVLYLKDLATNTVLTDYISLELKNYTNSNELKAFTYSVEGNNITITINTPSQTETTKTYKYTIK